MQSTQKELKSLKKNYNVGDKLSRLSYITILRKYPDYITVVNESGIQWSIEHEIVEAECYTAHSYNDTKAVTRSELIDIFNQTGDAIYTVNFNKQPKIEDAYEAICNKGKLETNKVMAEALSLAMKGEERTLVGYTIKREIAWGRSMVVDLNQIYPDEKIRQVDHRTLNWLICKNIMYVVKK